MLRYFVSYYVVLCYVILWYYIILYYYIKGVVSLVTRIRNEQLTNILFSIPRIGQRFSVPQNVTATHSSPFQWALQFHSPEVKWAGHEFDLSRPSSSDGWNALCYAVRPAFVFAKCTRKTFLSCYVVVPYWKVCVSLTSMFTHFLLYSRFLRRCIVSESDTK